MIPEELKERFNELNRLAVVVWGEKAQLDMVIEECGELIVALSHKRRRRVSWSKVVEEAVDVTIMLGQLEHILMTPISQDEINKMFRLKLRRMEMKLDLNQSTKKEK